MSKSFGLWNSRLLSVSRSELLHYGKCSIQVVLDISFSAAVLDRMIIISSQLLNLVLLQIYRRMSADKQQEAAVWPPESADEFSELCKLCFSSDLKKSNDKFSQI